MASFGSEWNPNMPQQSEKSSALRFRKLQDSSQVEHPILMSAPMMRAILAGSKTQTRRVAKGVNFVSSGGAPLNFTDDDIKAVSCPYGQPGDRLWVREAFRGCRAYEVQGYAPKDWGNKPIWFEADGTPPGRPEQWALRARPSIHMPRWASRITLEITSVRVERLHEISNEDAKAEGCDHRDPCDHVRLSCKSIGCPGPDYRIGYRALWEEINGAGSWDANPWVWVVEFKRGTP